MSGESSSNESPIAYGEPIKGFPGWFKLVLGLGAGVLLVFSLILYVAFIFYPDNIPSPSDLQLGSLILFSSTILIIVITPWGDLGIRINKIGPIEFERVINEQAREHIEEFSELRQRIDELEGKLRGIDEISMITEGMAAVELRPLIRKFLSHYSPTAYSPLRIQKWGSKQDGYEKLSNYDLSTIRKVLQDMVAENILTTRVSRMGNTLYQIVD